MLWSSPASATLISASRVEQQNSNLTFGRGVGGGKGMGSKGEIAFS